MSDADDASIALFFCMPAVFPLALLIGRITGEDVFGSKGRNELDGLFHAIARTLLVAVAWFVFPDLRFVVIPALIVAVYLVSIVALVTRQLPSLR